ncbi:MAG: M1 family metallopeptidase [Bacillota bacterium]
MGIGWVARQKRTHLFSSLARSGDEAAVTRYDISVRADVEQGRLEATAVLALRALVPGVTRHCFILNSGLDVQAVAMCGERLETRELELADAPGLKAVWVNLPKPLDGGQEELLTFVYAGRPEGGRWAHVDEGGLRLSRRAAWYPVGAGFDSFTARVACATLPGMVAVTDGDLVSSSETVDQAVYVWETSEPISGLALTSGRFSVERKEHRGVELELYLGPLLKDQATQSMDLFRGVIDAYFSMLGPPGASRFTAVLRRRYPGDEHLVRLVAALAHETAHIWWGSPISVGFGDTWFHEALARAMAYETVGRVLGDDARAALIHEEIDRYAADSAIGSGAEESVLSWAKSRVLDAPRPVCIRAALVLRLLHYTLGNEAFFETLSRHVSMYRAKPSGLSEFVEIAERVSGKPIEQFIRQWLGTSASFAYEIRNARCIAKPGGGFMTKFALVNMADAVGPVQADVLLAGGEWKTREKVTLTGRDQVLVICTKHPVSCIVLDPDAYLPNRSWRRCRAGIGPGVAGSAGPAGSSKQMVTDSR